MSLLDRILKNRKAKKDPFKNAPAFKQMVQDLQNELIARLEKILPVITPALPAGNETSNDDQPVAYPINFDKELSINMAMLQDTGSELLLNKHILIGKESLSPDKIVTKAFGNLFRLIENSMSISMVTKDIGRLSGCNGYESSLVLINEIWKLVRDNLNTGEIVFGIPSQDTFIFTAAGNKDAIGQLESMIREHYDDPSTANRISRQLYITHENGVSEIFRNLTPEIPSR